MCWYWSENFNEQKKRTRLKIWLIAEKRCDHMSHFYECKINIPASERRWWRYHVAIDSTARNFNRTYFLKALGSILLSSIGENTIGKVGRVDRRLSGHGAGLEKVKSVGSAD